MIVIEAPGKLNALKKALRSIGREDIRAFATGGHLFTNGEKLYPLGIDSNFRETGLRPVNPETVNLLKEGAQEAGYVIIATDPDVEGNVIASDVERAVDVPCTRIKLTALDPASLKAALEKAAPLNPWEADPGISRRIMDRLIGGLYSNTAMRRPVGRIQSAFLGLVSRANPFVAEMRVSVPAKDGGKDFVATLPLTADDLPFGEQLFKMIDSAAKDSLRFGVAETTSEEVPPPPVADCGEMILHVAEQLDSQLDEVQAAMQRLYELGHISYFRTDSRVMSQKAKNIMQAIASDNGIETDQSLLNDEEAGDVQGGHDALHPIRKPENLHVNPKSLPFDEAVLMVIARRQLDAMRPSRVRTDIPDLQDAPKPLQKLKWRRETARNIWNGEKRPKNGVTRKPIDRILFQSLIEARLGRPGTQVGHIQKFIDRGYVDDLARISVRGNEVLEYTQLTLGELLDPEVALGVENLLFQNDEKSVPQKVHAAFEHIRPGLSHEIRWMLQKRPADGRFNPGEMGDMPFIEGDIPEWLPELPGRDPVRAEEDDTESEERSMDLLSATDDGIEDFVRDNLRDARNSN